MKMSAIPERRRQEADDQDQEQWEDASHGEEKQTERTNDRLRRFLKSASATYAPIAIINSRTSISWNMVTPRVSTWHTTSSFQTPSASHMQLANGHNNRSRLLAKANPHAPSNSLNLKSHTRPSSSARTALSSADTRQTYRSRLFVADPRQQSARAIRREREAADRQAFFELRLRELQETITNVQALRRAESAKPKMRKGSSIMKGIDRVLESSGKRTRS